MQIAKLLPSDVQMVVSHIPRQVRDVMVSSGVILGGGFIRAKIAGEKPSDIDLFGKSKDVQKAAAKTLASLRNGRMYETENAFTVLAPPRLPVQFITRWLYYDPVKVILSFDFTVAQAVIWFDDGAWRSLCSDRFYADLAARRLFYTSPDRVEDAGGSIMRVRKFLSRGYNIQAESFGAVIARLMANVDMSKIQDEKFLSAVVTGLLREVDPLSIIDGGIELADEHSTPVVTE